MWATKVKMLALGENIGIFNGVIVVTRLLSRWVELNIR
ncbi:hypothetical protein VL20_3645 [Microcystis panniformis FACHB-1757]|uniref:Uncharacterized protein n=1 Tax=Microcystis panniformis FACHB-1757 TaxID=1638788 RepID=A0A0K1S3D0_9CHRO|nr:hypothetical protein VL20_3645 [Microcystis panniformis FACHB-1757]